MTTERGEMRMESIGGNVLEHEIGKGPKKDLPIEFESVNGMLDHMITYVRGFWLGPDARDKDDKDKSFMPMITAVCENGDILPIMVGSGMDEASKDDLVEMCQKNFQQWGVVRYVFASEAWIASYSGDAAREAMDNPNRPMPSQMENRIEAMTIQAIDKDGSQASAALEMVRDWQTGLVTDLKEHMIDRAVPSDMRKEGSMKLAGRFTSLLDGFTKPKNPLHSPQNAMMVTMFKTVLNPPEEMLRDKFEERGLDYRPTYEAGKALLAKLEIGWDLMEKAETRSQQRIVAQGLNELMLEARAHIMTMMAATGMLPDDLKPEAQH